MADSWQNTTVHNAHVEICSKPMGQRAAGQKIGPPAADPSLQSDADDVDMR